MHARYKMFLDYINWRGRLYVNCRHGWAIERTPELKWLLKKGHLRRERLRQGVSQAITTLVPVKPYTVDKLLCPCCGREVSRPPSRDDRLGYTRLHAYNCSIRLDHRADWRRIHHKQTH